MRFTYQMLLPAVGLVLALGSTPVSLAQCGGITGLLGHRTAWESMQGTPSGSGGIRLLKTAFGQEDESAPEPSIVGFWHVKFFAMGNQGIPDKTEVDAGYAHWHSDGTELMNSGGHAPSTSSFCMGVWKKTAALKYELNHFAIAWDPTPSTADPDGVIVGPASIRESVTLSANGNAFTGTFVIIQYDETLKVLAEVKGDIKGTRINVNTVPTSVF
jgi:hypothetical protein